MTRASEQIAIVAAMVTQPWTSDAERQATSTKLLWIASAVQALETENARLHLTLDEIVTDARADADRAEARGAVVSLRPALALVERPS